jgi:peroxiredoxin Q/BCP
MNVTILTRPARLGATLMTAALLSAAPLAQTTPMAAQDAPPQVGQKAPDFTLTSMDGAKVQLSAEVARGPVVLIVLRGFPTYQCPFCTRQFADYLAHGADFDGSGARVLFVYPGSPEGLVEHAKALVADRPIPSSYRILMDPDYNFTVAYHLRWEGPQETSYPSTFVIGRDGVITFAHVSHEHADRVPAKDVLKALASLPK